MELKVLGHDFFQNHFKISIIFPIQTSFESTLVGNDPVVLLGIPIWNLPCPCKQLNWSACHNYFDHMT